ncbi:MAG: hypothetical protein IKZ94_05830, partial [Lachnospiraceae bacterium]|nr:hypothetical protein [Lachnospiraceae bacterium]
ADGAVVFANDVATIDASHTGDGYVCVKYTGDVETVKVLITPEGGATYTYNLEGHDYEVYPLTCGSTTYKVAVYTLVSEQAMRPVLHRTFPLQSPTRWDLSFIQTSM